MSAYVFLLGQGKKQEMYNELCLIALGSQGDSNGIQTQLKEWDAQL